MKDFYKEIGNKDENQLITEEYAKKIITESQTQNKQHNNEQPKQLKLSNIVKIEDKKIVNDPNDTKLTNVIFQSFAGRFALVNDGGDWVLFYLKTLQTAHQIYFIKHTNMQSLIGLPLNDKCTFIIMCYEEKGNYSFILGTKKEIINAQTTTQPTCLTLVGNDTFLYVADNNKKIKIVGNLSSQFKDGVLLDLSDNKQQTILAITNVTLNNPMFSDCLNEQWEITKDFGEITYLTHQVEIVKVVVQQTAKYEKTGNTFFNYSFTPTFSLNAKVKSADKKDQLKILEQNESAMIAKTFTTKNNETFILIVAKNEKNEHFIYKIDPTNLQNKQKIIINDSNRSISDIKQIEILKFYPHSILLLSQNGTAHILDNIQCKNKDDKNNNEYTCSATKLSNTITSCGLNADGDLVAFSNGYLTKLSGDCKNSIHRQLNSQEITELLSSATKNSNLCLDFTDIDLTREAIELLANLPTKQYEQYKGLNSENTKRIDALRNNPSLSKTKLNNFLELNNEIKTIEKLTNKDEKKLQTKTWVAKLKQLTDTQLFTLLEQTNYQQNVARILTLIADNLGYKAAYNFVTRLGWKKNEYKTMVAYAAKNNDDNTCMACVCILAWSRCSILSFSNNFEFNCQLFSAANELFPRTIEGDKKVAEILKNNKISEQFSWPYIQTNSNQRTEVYTTLITDPDKRKHTLIEFFIQFGCHSYDGFGMVKNNSLFDKYTIIPGASGKLIQHNFIKIASYCKLDKKLLLDLTTEYVNKQLTQLIPYAKTPNNIIDRLRPHNEDLEVDDATVIGYFTDTFKDVINQKLSEDYKTGIDNLLSRILKKLNTWITKYQPLMKDVINAFTSLFESINKNPQLSDSDSIKLLCSSFINYISDNLEPVEQANNYYKNYAVIKNLLTMVPSQHRNEEYNKMLLKFMKGCALVCLSNFLQTAPKTINGIKQRVKDSNSLATLGNIINDICEQKAKETLETPKDSLLGKETETTYDKIFNETKCNLTTQEKIKKCFIDLQDEFINIKTLVPKNNLENNNLIFERNNVNNEIVAHVPLMEANKANSNNLQLKNNSIENNNINNIAKDNSKKYSQTETNEQSLQAEIKMPPPPTADDIKSALKAVIKFNEKQLTKEKKEFELKCKQLEAETKKLIEDKNNFELEKKLFEEEKKKFAEEKINNSNSNQNEPMRSKRDFKLPTGVGFYQEEKDKNKLNETPYNDTQKNNINNNSNTGKSSKK